jgi:predicted ABC-type ATPase
MDAPILYVIAGPNGIGKTISDFYFVPGNIPVINSDEIAAQIRNSGKPILNTQEAANGKASELMDAYLKQNASFGFETNLCDVETWKSLLKIQELGYKIHIIYLSTSELKVLNSRIANRVKLGGHFVLPDVVRERYMAGLNLLNHYFDKPDKLQLFDNSETMKLVAEITKGEVVYISDTLPEWVTQYLGQKFRNEVKSETKARDLNSIDAVRKQYLENKGKKAAKKQSDDPDQSPERSPGRGRHR